jgi:hypothetical protein
MHARTRSPLDYYCTLDSKFNTCRVKMAAVRQAPKSSVFPGLWLIFANLSVRLLQFVAAFLYRSHRIELLESGSFFAFLRAVSACVVKRKRGACNCLCGVWAFVRE